MDLSLEPVDTEENKSYLDLLHKMKVALLFAVPVFIISMMEMVPNNPLLQVMDLKIWNWTQLILTLPKFYAGWMFY
jgi:Cu2+-exporting ATPase